MRGFHGDAPGNAAVRPGKGLHQTAKGGLPGRGLVPAFFMKRTLIFGLLLALLLTGCAETTRTDSRADSRADSQWTWHRAGQGDIFARSDTGYYFFVNGYLHYMDEETMTPVVVCGKPNCMHMQETDREKQRECHAYFTLWSGWGPTVYWQNGTVYVLSRGNMEGERAVLWQLSEDASTRTRLLTVPGAFDTQASGDSAALHRGCFYIAMTQFDEKGNAFHEIRRYDLSHPEAEPELLYESADQSIRSLSDVRIRDNCLIFRENREEGERALLQIRLDGDGAVQPRSCRSRWRSWEALRRTDDITTGWRPRLPTNPESRCMYTARTGRSCSRRRWRKPRRACGGSMSAPESTSSCTASARTAGRCGFTSGILKRTGSKPGN